MSERTFRNTMATLFVILLWSVMFSCAAKSAPLRLTYQTPWWQAIDGACDADTIRATNMATMEVQAAFAGTNPLSFTAPPEESYVRWILVPVDSVSAVYELTFDPGADSTGVWFFRARAFTHGGLSGCFNTPAPRWYEWTRPDPRPGRVVLRED